MLYASNTEHTSIIGILPQVINQCHSLNQSIYVNVIRSSCKIGEYLFGRCCSNFDNSSFFTCMQQLWIPSCTIVTTCQLNVDFEYRHEVDTRPVLSRNTVICIGSACVEILEPFVKRRNRMTHRVTHDRQHPVSERCYWCVQLFDQN